MKSERFNTTVQNSKDRSERHLVPMMVILALFILAACNVVSQSEPTTSTPQPTFDPTLDALGLPTPVARTLIDEADAEHILMRNIFERVSPAVVGIVAVSSPNGVRTEMRGSGFVYDNDGRIITSASLVNAADDIFVIFNDGDWKVALPVGVDIFSDLAVLQVSGGTADIIVPPIGDSDAIQVGDRALMLGNPFGLGSTMAVGIIGGIGGQLPSAQLIDSNIGGGFQNPSIIQISGDINPGQNGGPLLNSQGEVTGMVLSIQTPDDRLSGFGFAVPATTIERVVPELIDNGEMQYAWLGVTTLPAENGFGVPALAEQLNLSVTEGVLINAVIPLSPAANAGLQGGDTITMIRDREVCTGGDIIVAVDDFFVRGIDELLNYLNLNTKPGDTVNMLIVRGEDTLEIPVTLTARPARGVAPPPPCGESG